MNQQQFFTRFEELTKEEVETTHRKNSDYAEEGDAFKNFRMSEPFGIPPEKAIFVRMLDKMTRIGNLLDREGKVLDEKITDTCTDLSVYAKILRIYLETVNKK